MIASYNEALSLVREKARILASRSASVVEEVHLHNALGRVAGNDIPSPLTTPTFDSSAMDGFAVSSALISSATPSFPTMLRVLGTIAAGDTPLAVRNERGKDGSVTCVEIMTGAVFPKSLSAGYDFDACIPYEHVLEVQNEPERVVKLIANAPEPNQNRRLAGSDFNKGDLIVTRGSLIRPKHIMAMGSVGITHVVVRRKLQVAVWSTGSELSSALALGAVSEAASKNYQISDANGPYLASALQALGVDVQFQGVVCDDADALAEQMRQRLLERRIDIIITTGAVSAGLTSYGPRPVGLVRQLFSIMSG